MIVDWKTCWGGKIGNQVRYAIFTVILSPVTAMYMAVCEHFINICETSNISRTLVGNKIVDHSDVVGASPVGAAPTTSSFSA